MDLSLFDFVIYGLIVMGFLVGVVVVVGFLRRLTYPIRIRIVTTSDWTTLRVVSGAVLVGPAEIQAGEGAVVAEFEGGLIRLTQSCSQAADCKTLEMTLRLSLIDPMSILYNVNRVFGTSFFLPAYVEFELERGHWGWTHVELSNCLSDDPVVVENYWWSSIASGERNVKIVKAPRSELFYTQPPNPQPALLTTTLEGKVLFGYQGWFGCPGDGSDRDSWVHWFRDNMPTADRLTVDFWPDMSEFYADERFPTAMTLSSGRPAELFSSYIKKTVDRHFKWMEEYGIDGVFAQRFLTEIGATRDICFRNQVVQNVRLGAEKHGRVFAIMYDVSGAIGPVPTIKRDWTFLVEVLKITESPNYLRHNGKPVVGIWGPGFNHNAYTTSFMAQQIISWLQNEAPDRCRATVVGGVPTHWRTLNNDSRSEAEWATVYRSYDVISPWTVGRYDSIASIDAHKVDHLIPDMAEASAVGVACMPVIWPGFSWHNLFPTYSLNQIPRAGGNFYWRQAYNAIAAGAKMLYVAMFDEVDEGTAMFKLAPSSADIPRGAQLVTLNIDGYGLPSDYYLRLGGQTCRTLRGEIPLTTQPP